MGAKSGVQGASGKGQRRVQRLKEIWNVLLHFPSSPTRLHLKGRHPRKDSNKCNPAPLDSGIIFNIYAINVHFVRLNDRQ